MLTPQKTKELAAKINNEINNAYITNPSGLNGTVFNELKFNIELSMKTALRNCFDVLLKELEYTDDKLADDFNLKS